MEIQYYCSSGGTNYVGDFIMVLPVKAAKKVRRRLGLVTKYGINFMTHSGTVKKLHGYDLYEIVINFNKVFYRIICSIKNGICWLLHMFTKKSNNTPIREIRTAVQRSRDLDIQLEGVMI